MLANQILKLTKAYMAYKQIHVWQIIKIILKKEIKQTYSNIAIKAQGICLWQGGITVNTKKQIMPIIYCG